MSMTNNQASITEAAGQVVAANANRIKVTLRNTGANTVYIGFDASVTSSNGFTLVANSSLTDSSSLASIYAICAAGKTSTISYVEEDLTGVN